MHGYKWPINCTRTRAAAEAMVAAVELEHPMPEDWEVKGLVLSARMGRYQKHEPVLLPSTTTTSSSSSGSSGSLSDGPDALAAVATLELQPKLPPNTHRVTVGASCSAVITNTGDLWVWGSCGPAVGSGWSATHDNVYVVPSPRREMSSFFPQGTRVTAVSLATTCMAAVTDTGTLYLWGAGVQSGRHPDRLSTVPMCATFLPSDEMDVTVLSVVGAALDSVGPMLPEGRDRPPRSPQQQPLVRQGACTDHPTCAHSFCM